MSLLGTDKLSQDAVTKSIFVQIQDGQAGILEFSFAYAAQGSTEGWGHTSVG